MNLYNLAYLPVEDHFQKLFTDLAQLYFKDEADGYLLGEGALPHVTLCQFECNTPKVALETFRTLPINQTLFLSLDRFVFRQGRDDHEGKIWAQFQIKKSPVLLTSQKECAHHLSRSQLRSFTPITDYSPHVTLARLSKQSDINEERFLRLFPDQIEFRLSLGGCSPLGVFIAEVGEEKRNA